MSESLTDAPKIGLVALFVTSLITAQIIAVKILAIPLSGSVPLLGAEILVPAGVLAYAATFFASDCYVEVYGRKEAQVMVNIAFFMNFVMLALLWLAIWAPGSPAGVDPAAFGGVLGLSTNIVIASLVAYIVSQNYDVVAFHLIGARTRGKHLWMRNIGSTGTSQFIDTVIFVSLAFAVIPAGLGIGAALPGLVLAQLIVGQYLIKLLIALVDTPLVYLFVNAVESRNLGQSKYVPA